MEHWNRLPGESVESPSIEIFKIHLNAYLCDLLQVACFSRGVELSDLLRSLPTHTILWFCYFVKQRNAHTQGDEKLYLLHNLCCHKNSSKIHNTSFSLLSEVSFFPKQTVCRKWMAAFYLERDSLPFFRCLIKSHLLQANYIFNGYNILLYVLLLLVSEVFQECITTISSHFKYNSKRENIFPLKLFSFLWWMLKREQILQSFKQLCYMTCSDLYIQRNRYWGERRKKKNGRKEERNEEGRKGGREERREEGRKGRRKDASKDFKSFHCKT